jgi:TonB family protein
MPSPPKLATLNADAANVPVAPTPAMEIPKLPVPVKIAPPRPRPREAVTKPAPEPRAAPAPPQIGVEANAPMPSLAADLVAVSLAPAPPEEEIVVPRGSRAGEFHASPEGTGTESGPVPVHSEVVATSAETPASELPNRELADIRVPGLSVSGSAPPPPGIVVENRPEEDFKKLLAKAGRPSLIPEMPHARPLEPEFFGSRRVYTTYLNMPNLASGSGSWVLRFAELDADEPAPGGGSELSTPEAIRKVDPMYVAAAARERVQGTVLLAALILKDGSVANIRVVRSLDARLDSSAVSALTQWHFRPATRNGAPVDLEVLVQIPFRLPSF